MTQASTNLYALQPYNQDAWGHKAYDEFIENFFFTSLLGEGEGAVIEHITELTKNRKGEAGAWLHLIPDIHGGGIVGDNQAVGRERSLDASWYRCDYDQFRNGMVTKGRLAEQKSVVMERKQFRKKMARWYAESLEDQAILTASGIGYDKNVDGSPRVTPAGQDPWTDLAYAAKVRPPSAGRYYRWDATDGIVAGDTTAVAAADVPTYNVLPDLEALAAQARLTPLRIGKEEYWIWLIHKKSMARLWKDEDFRKNVVDGSVRGPNNPIFANSKVTMNNIIIKPYQRVYNTYGAASGSKWGGGAVDGTRSLLLGAQSLGFVDLGAINWEEEVFDAKNRWGLYVDKMVGWEKPMFKSSYTNTNEDLLVAFDMAL